MSRSLFNLGLQFITYVFLGLSFTLNYIRISFNLSPTICIENLSLFAMEYGGIGEGKNWYLLNFLPKLQFFFASSFQICL